MAAPIRSKRLNVLTARPATSLVVLAVITAALVSLLVLLGYLVLPGVAADAPPPLFLGIALISVAGFGGLLSLCAAGRVAQRLRIAEDRLSLALSSAQIGIWDLDLKTGEATLVGEFFDKFRRKQTNTMPIAEWTAIVHEEDRDGSQAVLQTAINEKGLYVDEYRVVRPTDGAARWFAAHGRVVCDRFGTAVRLSGVNYDITERKSFEEHLQLTMRELSHRSKNLLAVVQSMARQTARQSTSVAEFEERFSARIQALARAHDLLVKQDWRGVPLLELIEVQVEPFADMDIRIDAEGPSLSLNPSAAQHIALALHELANNAAKYGALSNRDGSVEIRWSVDPVGTSPRRLHMTWQELGGPPVAVPERRGFGTFVIEKMVAAGLNGAAALTFDPAGVRWTLDVPAELQA